MAKDLTEDQSTGGAGTPLKVAIAVAVFGVLGMLIVDHGPWNKPKVQHPLVANYSYTGDAARAAGAQGHSDRAEAAGGARATRTEARSSG